MATEEAGKDKQPEELPSFTFNEAMIRILQMDIKPKGKKPKGKKG